MQIKNRRMFAWFLVLVLVFGMLPTSVFAAEEGAANDQLTDKQGQGEANPSDENQQEEIDIESIWAEIEAALPAAYYDPSNPANPYPKGNPVDNFFPEEFHMDPSQFPVLFTVETNYSAGMWDNTVLDALQYLGYDVKWLKDNGVLFDYRYMASRLKTNKPSVLTDIGYSDELWLNGDDTIADSSTVTGLAPNVARFEQYGLCCASFVAYYYCNYLPNIEGFDTAFIYDAIKEAGWDSKNNRYDLTTVVNWKTAMDKLASTDGSGVTRYRATAANYANLEPGDLILFESETASGTYPHLSIYLGTGPMDNNGTLYGTYHYIAHVGNSRGPEISVAEFMAQSSGDKASAPAYLYHIDFSIYNQGDIEVYKKDTDGNGLAGAQFVALNTETNVAYNLGPTDANGYAKTVDKIPYGTYIVTETVYPDGYQTPAGETNQWTVIVGTATPTVTINAVNELKPGYIKIIKSTEDGLNLTGWSFKLTNTATGAEIGIYTIQSGNSVTAGPLDANVSYTVTEVVPADSSYTPEVNPQTVTVTPGATVEVTFVNKLKYGTAQIFKHTTNGGSKQNWEFTVKTSAGTVVGTYKTDANGLISLSLLPGTYIVTESSTTYEYWKNDPVSSRNLTVEAGKTSSVAFTNEYRGKGQIIKTATNGGSVQGWTFTVKNSSGTVIGTYTTPASGIITLDLEPGTYTVTENATANDYWINDPTSTRTLVVEAGKTSSVTFVNQYVGIGRIVKATTNGGSKEGWTFTVKNSSGTVIGTYTTDASGVVELTLNPGTYTVTETNSKDYWKNDPTATKTLVVEAGKTSSVSFTNEYLGKLEINKATTNGGTKVGWSFEIKNASGAVVGTYVTTASGVITLDLQPGTYTVAETNADSEYWRTDRGPKTITVVAGQTSKVTFTNEFFGKGRIVKETTNGGSKAGWTFEIKNASGSVVATKTTDASGVIVLDLEPGTYTVTETNGVKDYWHNDPTASKTLTITAGQTATVTFTNEYVGKGKIVKETTNGGSKAGWIFEIKNASGSVVATKTTDASGVIVLDLEPGTYTVTETNGAQTYWHKDPTSSRTLTVQAGSTATVTFTNEYVGIGQIVKETTNGGSKAGWTFEVKNAAGTVIGTYTTEANGIISLDLQPGTYTVTETNGVRDYWHSDPAASKTLTIIAGQTSKVTFTNEYVGKGKIVKNTTNGGSKAGWTFEVKTADGSVIGTYTTAADGVILLDLEPGTYTVTETNGIKDYWHNDPTASKILTVTAGQTAEVIFTNEYIGKGKIVKETTNNGTKEGWIFEIKNAAGTVIGTYTTDASGIIVLDLEPGTYTVTETNAVKNYWINDPAPSKTLTVKAGETATVTFINEYLGNIQVTKTTNTGDKISNWRFGIYTDSACSDASLVEIVTTNTNGIVVSSLLNPGTYYVKELDRGSAGNYFDWALDTSVHAVTVTAGKTENINIRNNNYGRIQMVKTTNTGVDLAGWLVGVYTDADCKNPIAGSPFVTDANGVVYTTTDGTENAKYLPLEPGAIYYVKELGRQDGNETYWVLDATVHAVTIEASETHTVTFRNIHRGLAQIVKITNTGLDLEGWIIDIYSDEALTNKIGELTTNDQGKAELFLEPGVYWFVERSNGNPYWICDTAPRSAEIKPGADTQVSFLNNHMGRIQIVKTMATDGPVDGWQFKITDSTGAEIPGSPFTTVKTTVDGKEVGLILTDLLAPGTYTIEELFPNDSLYYCKSENPQTVAVLPGATTEVSFVNALRPGKITVDKINWAGDYLAGATFLLEWSEDGNTWYPVTYSDKEDVIKGGCSNADLVDGCVTTDDTGKLEFGNLYPGIQYRLTEVEAPEGYILLADYAYEGTLPVKDLTISLTVHNSKGYILPTTGSVGTPMATGGMIMVLLAIAALMLFLSPQNILVIHGEETTRIDKIQMKGKRSAMKKKITRIFSIVLALVLLISLAAPVFAADSETAVIDETATGSMTIYKIDFTNAEKDGVWDQSYVSTGVYDGDVNDTLINEAVRDGASGNEATLGNGDTSYGYAIKGVEFTYLRIAKIRTYSEAEEVVDGKYQTHVEVLYGVPANDGILPILGLDKDDRYAPADIDGENIWYYQSDVLIQALKTKLANQPTDTKNKLEAYITANSGTAMPETNAYGKTSADGLPLGLYLVLETGLPQQVSSSVDPFLVSLPMTSVNGGNANDGGTRWIYNVTLYPKNTTSIPSLEKTVRESKADGGNNGATETITDGFAHTATASSGDTVEFQIISTLPTITSNVTALTTYGFEDTMAAGLRYNQDTIKLEWFKDKSCTEKIASWTVNGEKFKATFGVNGDKSTMTIAMTADGLEEINHSETVYAADTVRRGYSDMTLRITYTAELESDDTLIFGEKGNENVVILKWQRTNADYFDTLVDDCHIYAFGIDLTKEFSDGRGDYTAVTFVVFNESDGQWVQASKNDATGIYYMTGWVTDEANATAFTPTDKGKLIIKGLEDDTYILTETNTDNGYTLLKDHITVEITISEKDVCGIYETDALGLVQNDPRFQGVTEGLYHNVPQVALAHKTLTAAATVDGNAVNMLPDDTSAQAFAPLTVVNTHGFNLPQTGEVGAVIMPLIGIFVIVAAYFVILMVMPRCKEEG